MQILHPPGWAPARGYANGVVTQGRLVFLGGQIGWNAEQVFETRDFVEQAEQALRNILTILAEAGGEARHIARLTWYVVDRDAYLARQKELGLAYRRVMGRHFPAMTMIQVKALAEAEALVEIEATAVLP
jgi:enamine deaminase RidA (YjgF/YER057c/UK114 family)